MERKRISFFELTMYAASALLVLLMLVVAGRCFVQWVLIDALGMTHPLLLRVVGASESNNAPTETAAADGPFAAYETAVADAEQRLTDAVTDYIPLYTQIVEWMNRIEMAAGFGLSPAGGQFDYNAVIDLGGGYLIYRTQPDDQSTGFHALVRLREMMGDVPMLYLMLPAKICAETDKDFDGVMNSENADLDVFASLLEQTDIPLLDLRAALHADGMDHHAAFYRNDHHWLPETGRWAAEKTALELQKLYGLMIDTAPFAADRYTETVYEDWCLGSQGKKLTLSRVSAEDFSLFYPTFTTQLRLSIPDIALEVKGGFEILYDMSYFDVVDYYGTPPYAAYLHDNHPYVRIDNDLCPDGPNILMIGDSFDNVLATFLSQSVARLDAVDLRLWESKEAFADFLSENLSGYDAVIISSNKFPILQNADAPAVDPRF